jgi:hypothetical protein
MEKNIGIKDRLVRFALGIALMLYGWWTASWIALGLGVFTLLEAGFSWCILYWLIGKNSCPLKKD